MLLVLLCLILPFLAVLIKKGPCIQVLWAFLSYSYSATSRASSAASTR